MSAPSSASGGPRPWRGGLAWWLLLAAPAAVLLSLPAATAAAFAQCGFGACAGESWPSVGWVLLAGGLWLVSGAVVALPWVLLRWAPSRVRWPVGAVLAVGWAAAGMLWVFAGQ